jgi:GNAT superfamily N-acetyltransferase
MTIESGYEIKSLSTEEFDPLFSQLIDGLFKDTLNFPVRNFLSQAELDAGKILGQNMGQPYRLNLGLYYQGQLVGWSWGYQESREKFYVCNSAVFPEHRRKGLYTKLMARMTDTVAEQGFQVIYSRHLVTNNAVLIPKLKFGFVMTSFEVSDVHGLLVHLSYFTNPLRRKMLDFRTGMRPDAEIRECLNI